MKLNDNCQKDDKAWQSTQWQLLGTGSVTAFGKLVRTTAFRLTLVYLFLFAIFAASLLGYFAWNTRRLITEEITQTVNAETSRRSTRSTAVAACAASCSRSSTGRCGRAPTSIS
ncbi:hypothetical protein ACVWXN_005222 [Bradyrhizobium sp. i1.4.4]